MFILAYIVASVTLAPAFLLTFAAGAVFGLLRGTILVYVGAVLGSSAVFAIASPLAQLEAVCGGSIAIHASAAVRSAVVGQGHVGHVPAAPVAGRAVRAVELCARAERRSLS